MKRWKLTAWGIWSASIMLSLSLAGCNLTPSIPAPLDPLDLFIVRAGVVIEGRTLVRQSYVVSDRYMGEIIGARFGGSYQ